MRMAGTIVAGLLAIQSTSPSVRAGVLTSSGERPVVAIGGPALAVGTSLTIVAVASDRQEVSRVVVTKQLAASDVMARHTVQGPYYEVVGDPGSQRLPDFAVAIVGRGEVERIGNAVAVRIGAATVRARSCASSEGVHLTLWAGEPLKSQRLWHQYYYLGYDVEPTCQPADIRTDSR